MKSNKEKYSFYQKNSRYQFCEIPNDEVGQAFVKQLKKYLNKHRYTVRVKGQYLDKEKYPDTYFSKGAKLDACTHIRVYVDEKKEIRDSQWREQVAYGLRHAIHTLEHKLKNYEVE